MIHSFLLIGQSNMAGRGLLSEAPQMDHTNIRILRNGFWKPVYFRPINPDSRFAGFCLGESFAERYAAEHQVEVGLICCAEGGTCIDQWSRGSILFDHACAQAKLAARTSKICGVLWHQGESDCPEELYPGYGDKLAAVMAAFREELGLEEVPFILGEIGEFLGKQNPSPVYQNYAYINEAIREYVRKTPWTGLVSTADLPSGPDFLHFNTSSLYEMGLRYYGEYIRCMEIFSQNKKC